MGCEVGAALVIGFATEGPLVLLPVSVNVLNDISIHSELGNGYDNRML